MQATGHHTVSSILLASLDNLKASNTSSLDIVNAVIAVLGFVLAAASLAWQTITWRKSGGVAKADLFLGAIEHTGAAYITVPATSSLTDLNILESEGFTRKAIFVAVRNTGRLPLTVQNWSVRFPGRYRSAQSSFAIGPKLPHRIDVGESETWGVEIERFTPIAQVLRDSKNLKSVGIRVDVELGDSRSIRTRQKARL